MPKTQYQKYRIDLLAHMATYVQVVESGSFAAASELLGVTAPMIGRQVKALESHLGTQLLRRTTRRHSLTEAGRIYYERCKSAIAEVRAADESVARVRATPRGLLRIDAPVTFGSIGLAPALADYMAAFPEVRIELTLNNRVVDLIEEGYDVVIRTGELPDSGLMARALAPYPLLICAAPSYLEQRGEPKSIDDLKHHACLGFRPGSPFDIWTFIDDNDKLCEVKVTGPFSSNSGQALRAAALAGAGITMQATALLKNDVERGALRPVLLRMKPKPLPMHLVYPASQLPSLKLRTFLDFMSERFR